MRIRTGLSRTSVRAIFVLCICLAATGVAHAATHWVSPTGAAAWGSCVGATPLSGASACSLAAANSNAAAGDLVYLRAGTYSTELKPAHSGSGTLPSGPFNFITFQAYTGETPTISTSGDGFDLTALSYIRIGGITFTLNGNGAFRLQNGSNHNEIDHCTFNSPNGYNMNFLINTNGGNWSTHNWIHDNTFITTGQAHGNAGTGCTDGGGDTMDIGVPYGTFGQSTDNDNNNTIENNIFDHAPHASTDNYGLYTVFRNNVYHNEPWSSGCTNTSIWPPTYSSNPNYTAYNGLYAHRNFQITEDYGRTATYVLVEGNRVGYAGINDTNGVGDNFDLAAPQNIVRYNFLYASMNNGLVFKYGWGGSNGGGGNGGTYNRVYNNTIYMSGYGYPKALNYISGNNSSPQAQSNMDTYAGSNSGVGNVVKNNLLYNGDGYTNWGTDFVSGSIGGTAPPYGVGDGWNDVSLAANNWCSGTQTVSPGPPAGACTAMGDPQFNNPDLSNPASTTLPDLSLKLTSGAIDGGTYLTTATNSGNSSTTLTVADALYFQDGTWGSDLARASAGRGGTFQADWIAIGTVSNTVKISSVTYGTYTAPTGTITLASPMTWSSGAHIWLYKKSDGAVVLYGTAPDYGASEFCTGGAGGTGAVAPPSCLQATVVVH
jgi:hypothetical protein